MKRFKELRLKNVELPMGVVPEKPTNADRIRAMSDEELAKMLTIGQGGFDCSTCKGLSDCRCCEQNCEKQCLKWLQKMAVDIGDGT